MLGGLYGDLPPPTSAPGDDDKPAASVWSSATKMAPPTLRKPSATFAPPTSLLRNPRPKTTTTTTTVQQPVTTTSVHPAALVAVQSNVLEEYDPARPNDYEDYRKERLRRAKDAEVRKELERRRRDEEEREQREAEARLRLRDAEQSRASAALNISGEEAWMRRAAMSGGGSVQSAAAAPSSPPQGEGAGGGGFTIPGSSTSGLGLGAGGQMTAAQRMMAKMGWKAGQGLGKQEQGITTPLVARKTDRRAGVIVDESSSKKPKSVNIEGQPTRVLLLRNMVNAFPRLLCVAPMFSVLHE
jgi:splicing factor 45